MGPFFADFVCRAEKVVVEIDGGTHSTAAEIAYDTARETYLRAQGYRIFRAHNGEVYENIDGVCEGASQDVVYEAGRQGPAALRVGRP